MILFDGAVLSPFIAVELYTDQCAHRTLLKILLLRQFIIELLSFATILYSYSSIVEAIYRDNTNFQQTEIQQLV